MKKILFVIFLLNASLAFCGGPSIFVEIANLTKEDVYVTVRYNRNVPSSSNFNYDFFVYDVDEYNGKRVRLPSNLNAHGNYYTLLIVVENHSEDEILDMIRDNIHEINIHNSRGALIMNKNNILQKGFDHFEPNESHDPDFNWTGFYYIYVR